MELTPPRAILFDWDNTLVDTWPVIHKALHDTFVQYHMTPWTLQEVKDRVAKSMRDSFPELFGEQWEEAGKAYQHYYRSQNLDMLQPLPDALTLLEMLEKIRLFKGIVSNKKSITLNAEAEHLGWSKYFDRLVGSDDAAFDKPHPAPVELVLSGSGITPAADVWFVGDSAIDLECAEACGMTAILYGDVMTDAGTHYKGVPFHHHVRNHAELIHLLHN